MSAIYNIHEAKAQFSRLMRQVEEGHEVLIEPDRIRSIACSSRKASSNS